MEQLSSKKIMVFTTAYKPFVGGSELAIQEIIKRLPEFFFEILTPRLRRHLPLIENGSNFSVHRIGWGIEKLDKLIFPIIGFNYAQKLIRRNNYHLVHAFQASHAAGAAWRLKLSNKNLPFVVTLQEGKDLDKQSFFIGFARKIILSQAERITVISEHLKNYAKKSKKNFKIDVIPNGVDVENFSREFSYGELSKIKDDLGIKPGEKIIVSASRLVEKNGISDLVKAFALLCRKRPDQEFKLLLIGSGSEKNNLEELAKELGIMRRIIFTGDVEHDQLPKFLKISDMFVRPSLSEGLGNAFLEAMTVGVPIIGTNVGGIPDFLKDPSTGSGRATGLFCLPDNPESIVEKISFLLDKHDLRQKIIANAAMVVKEKYDWDKIARGYEAIYNEFQ